MTHPPRHGLAVTRWHDGATTVPGQPGVYERDIPLAPYSYWNSVHAYWCHSAQTAEHAKYFCLLKSINQDADWRGLAEEHRGKNTT